MACGTPVVAYHHGSVPEVVDEGIAGFVVDNETAAVAAVEMTADLDRTAVRAQFETRFSVERMAKDYVAIYEGMTNGITNGFATGVPQSDIHYIQPSNAA